MELILVFRCLLMLRFIRFRYRLLTNRAEKAFINWYPSVWNRFRSIKTFFASWIFVVLLGHIIMKWFYRLSYFTFSTTLLRRIGFNLMLLSFQVPIIWAPWNDRTTGASNFFSFIFHFTIFTYSILNFMICLI
jgi:hypothetical protein